MRVVFKLMEPFLINKQVCATTAVDSRGNDDNNPFRETRDILTRIICSGYHFVFSFISIEAVKIDWIYLLLIEIMVWWFRWWFFMPFVENGWFDCLPFQNHFCHFQKKIWKMVLVEPPLVFYSTIRGNWGKHEFLLISNNWKIRWIFREILCGMLNWMRMVGMWYFPSCR